MDFPMLNSGAVTQYPASVGFSSPTQVIRFLDGTDQRFLVRGRILRRWLIDLGALNESEIAALELFFNSLEGEYSMFDFPDPIGGTSVPNCRIGAPALISEYQDVDIAGISFWVAETNG